MSVHECCVQCYHALGKRCIYVFERNLARIYDACKVWMFKGWPDFLLLWRNFMRSSYQCTCKATCTHCVVFLMHFALPDLIFLCSARYFCTVSRIDQGFHHHVTCSVPYLHVQNWNLGTVFFTGGSCDLMLYACSTLNSLMYIAGYPRGLYGSVRPQRREGRPGKECQSLNKYVCVQNPNLCLGLLGINDYSAVYFGILYKCLIRS